MIIAVIKYGVAGLTPVSPTSINFKTYIAMNAYKELFDRIDDVQKYIDAINWAYVDCYGTHLILPSNRTKEDETAFIEGLKTIDYDDGYGTQELFGTITFKNGTWLDRYEYDGSECWSFNKYPQEPNWEERAKRIKKAEEEEMKYLREQSYEEEY